MSRNFSLGQRILHLLAGLVGHWVIRLYFLTIHSVNNTRSRKTFNHTHRPHGIYPFWHAHPLAALVGGGGDYFIASPGD